MFRLIAILVLSGALYTCRLDRVPAFLTLDEAHFSVHAHALADTGRNLNGQFLPLLKQAPHPRLALAAGAILGLGIYAYVTSIVFMPFFLAVFWLIAWRAGVLDRRAWLGSIAGFAAALVPMVVWLLAHPDAAVSIREQYNRADPGSATLMETIASGGLPAAAREFLRIYWSYFDPSFLLVQGGNARNLST